MENIQIVVPVMDIGRFRKLAENICANSHKPSLVVIVDNSKWNITDLPFDDYGIPYIVVVPPTPLATNAAWTLGISMLSECDYVSILNDDIEIHSHFFSCIIRNFKHTPDAGAICPCTIMNKEHIYTYLDYGTVNTPKMKHKEGWAFTIRKNLLDEIPPIPTELTMFFGDDWYWWHTYKRGFLWYKDSGVIIYHAVGASLRKIDKEERDDLRKAERSIWYDMKDDMIKDPKYQKY